jgi:hypothetical protein
MLSRMSKINDVSGNIEQSTDMYKVDLNNNGNDIHRYNKRFRLFIVCIIDSQTNKINKK